MDTSIKQYTRLVFDHGNLQASPKHIALLNQQPATLFTGRAPTGTTPAGYQVVMTGYANFVYTKERLGRELADLVDLLNSLRASPRPVNALALKRSFDTYRVENDSFRADYRVYSGQVVIYNIQPVDKLQRQRDRAEKIGVYRIKKNASGIWELAGKIKVTATQYAAVNGQSNNLTKATWLMGRHLEFALGRDLKEYTLFHNPSVGGLGDTWESVRDKLGFTTPVTREFARLLSQTQAAGNETRWVAHSQGGLIFTEAVRFLLNGESSYALDKFRLNGMRNPDKGTLIRRWWDIKEPGFFGKKLGIVMMNISVRKVSDNTQHLLGSEPYDVTDRLSFMLMLTEDAQLKHPKNQYTVAPSPERDPFSYYVPDFVTMAGSKLHPSFRDESYGGQVWTRYGVSAPESVLITNYALPVTLNLFLEVSFYYSNNHNVVARYFRETARSKMHPILSTFRVLYADHNPIKNIVEHDWHSETTQEVVDRHKPHLILKLFGEEAYRDVYLEAPTSSEQ